VFAGASFAARQMLRLLAFNPLWHTSFVIVFHFLSIFSNKKTEYISFGHLYLSG